ncbi:related to major facilitator MirA [Cephalotrichum gorgonifer]|uniref:Related to major facilitator MirA n=1 Tax=Cephalotrichum gorgonifer TaxID=2041049 RepID=A0AAE8N695_9PEZI|nr:related to major facilitator MirA [Cephalotrichum gorgonifer]
MSDPKKPGTGFFARRGRSHDDDADSPLITPGAQPGTGAETTAFFAASKPRSYGSADASNGNVASRSSPPDDLDEEQQHVAENVQAGVQQIEATALTWTRNELLVAYAMVWFVYFLDSLQQNVTANFTPWVTSSFRKHSLTPVTTILSSLIGGLWKLPLAKILDVWGRPQGYAMSVALLTLGLVMMALCRNVEMYCAAQVLYWVGYNGVIYSLSVFIADTSALKSRGLMLAYGNSPYIITAWIGGPIAQAFLDGPGFRWGFATFALVTPVLTMPLFFMLMSILRRAKAKGLVPVREDSKRSFGRSLQYYSREFDVVGLTLITVGLALFLLSFNLAPLHEDGWKSPVILTMVILGPLLIGVFVVWEKNLPDDRTFIPFRFLMDRTVLGACLLTASLFTSFYIWNSYFLSYLQVVHDLNTTHSSYIYYIFNVGGCLTSLVAGFIIRRRGTFKNLTLFFAIPCHILGISLMIVFRRLGTPLYKIILSQVVISVASGTFMICEQLATQSAVGHQHIAVMFAIQGVFASVGSAIGSTVSTWIWQIVFRDRLGRYLPDTVKPVLDEIYADLGRQKSYPMGSPERTAINMAYSDAQTQMLIPALAVVVPAIGFVLMWKNINVKNLQQVKGMVL